MAKNTSKLNDPCFDLDCITLPKMIKADPATAGRGIVIGFTIASGLTIVFELIIMAAFFWDKHHNRFHSDRRRRPSRFWRFRKLLRQVVASLSDNQLVTGLALSIPLIYRVNGDTGNNFTTVYTYNLVAFMLMLTLIAHACALLVCDHYFTRKKVLGSILRIIAIGAVLVLTTIVFASILRRGDWPLGSSANVALPAKCYIRNCVRAVYLGSVQQHGLRFGSITLHILVWVVYALAVFYQFIKFHYPHTAPEDEDKEKEPGFRDEDHNWKWRLFNALRLFFPAIAFSGAAWALWGSRNFHFTAPSPHPPFTEDSQNMWTFGQIVPFVLLLPSLQTIFDSYGDAYYQPERKSEEKGANGRFGYTRCRPNDGD